MRGDKMIDTIYICNRFNTYNEFEIIKNTLDNHIRSNIAKSKKTLHSDKKRKNSYITYAFSDIGFQEIVMVKNFNRGYFAIEIKLRPKLLIDKNYINVTYLQEFKDISKRFDDTFKEIGIAVPNFYSWFVRRIDYAVDIKVNPDIIQIYLQMFKLGNIPEKLLNDNLDYFDKDNNFYLRSKNYTINFYDRYTTLQNKKKEKNKAFYDIEKAKGIMRFEVQVTVNTNKLKKMKLISENKLSEFLNLKLCRHYIIGNFEKLIGAGDYHSLTGALEKISNKTKRKLIKDISKNGMQDAKYEIGDKKFSKLINDLRKKNINPVTIPEELKLTELKSLLPKINDAISDELLIRIKRRKI